VAAAQASPDASAQRAHASNPPTYLIAISVSRTAEDEGAQRAPGGAPSGDPLAAPRGQEWTRNRTRDWIDALYPLAHRLEQLDDTHALLDSAVDSEADVRGLALQIGALLHERGFSARLGIATGRRSALLALARASAARPQVVIVPKAQTAFLRSQPLHLLARPPAPLLNPEQLAQLERYGLRDLRRVALASAAALQRQFGVVGALLGALAGGDDPPLVIETPREAALRLRWRFHPALPPATLLARLPKLAAEIHTRLAEIQRGAGEFAIALTWESGARERRELTLPQPAQTPAHLVAALRRGLDGLLGAAAGSSPHASADVLQMGSPSSAGDSDVEWEMGEDDLARIEEVSMRVGRLSRNHARQEVIWGKRAAQERARRAEAIAVVAATLERRHGRPVLLRGLVARPEAIFAERRFDLFPLRTGAGPFARER
jgi:hypothetical protein